MGVNEHTISLRFVSQMIISSYRRKIRTLYLYLFLIILLNCFPVIKDSSNDKNMSYPCRYRVPEVDLAFFDENHLYCEVFAG